MVIFLLAAPSLSVAQENETVEDLVTDRPDATESSRAVPLHSLQVETGIFYESFKETESHFETIGYNTTLLRYGLFKNFELRVGWNLEETRTTFTNSQLADVASGFSPLLLGMKVELLEENGWMPEIALLGHIQMPFLAATAFRPENTGVDFRFSAAHTLSEASSIGYNLGAQWGNDSPEAAYVYTLAYGYSLTDNIGLYAEVYGDLLENSKANHFCDAGITYLIKKNIQLDATIGRSFTEGQDLLVSAGVSFRIPK
ncbi:Putative MetA-pathway of phenol degradation [Ulvibacter litoralis]|uniref:Putative MetA-pathway of phenol degradation n=2 Tax=Ulvibacter litoralis TaxID=227084 RepID=A0A1G7D2R1_9FLAO|nr:hypothetical protein GCM10008083_04730 [Ulvibacter litoralis]SDE45787.1 Putative MetA-pathway of phenol degradation [Ulvibacter litoralis]